TLSVLNPTSPIRPAVPEFSSGKSLSGKGCRGPERRKSAVVPTKSILTAANVPIIGGHHVLALQSSPEGWQATPLLERRREHAGRRRARGAAAHAVSGRDQRHAGIGLAAVDRGFGGWRRAAADTVAVSGRPCRGAAGGRLGRRRQIVGVASAGRSTRRGARVDSSRACVACPCRIKGLLFSQGISGYQPLRRDRRQRLEELQTG